MAVWGKFFQVIIAFAGWQVVSVDLLAHQSTDTPIVGGKSFVQPLCTVDDSLAKIRGSLGKCVKSALKLESSASRSSTMRWLTEKAILVRIPKEHFWR